MVLRFVYWSDPDVKKLIATASDFCVKKNIGQNTPIKAINIPIPIYNTDLKIYELALTVDVPLGPNPIGRGPQENVNIVDNVPFNVSDGTEEAAAEAKQEQVIVSS